MNGRDRNGLYGGGSIKPHTSDREHGVQSNRIKTTRVVESSAIGTIAVSRSKNLRSTYARMRYVKIVSMLVICAAATVLVSTIAHASVDAAKTAAPVAPAPGPPYLLYGYTYDNGGSPVECDIVVKNMRTGEVNTTNSYIVLPWPLDGYYEIDLQNQFPSAYQEGDLINVTATDRTTGTYIGWNESAVPTPAGGSMTMDVTLNGTVGIPEFPMVILPVTGMLALFAVVRLRRRGEEQ